MRTEVVNLLCAAGMLALSGCAGGGGGPLGLGAILGQRNLAGAEPLFSRDEQRCMGSADQIISAVFGPTVSADETKIRRGRPCRDIWRNLRQLLNARGLESEPLAGYDTRRRNEFIDALVASSNQKCTRYTALLKNADGAMNAGLSVGAIVTGGLGGILPGVNTAKALSGTASILAGSRAALNEVYLSNQTIHVLTAAYEKARRAKRRDITNREACTVEQYTIMRGLEDALDYHDSCSIVAGLAETALSIERSENPGLDAMRVQLNELANLRRQMAELTNDLPITPIAAAPSTVNLGKVIAADKALTTAQASLDAAAITKAQADTDVAEKTTALAAAGGSGGKEREALEAAKVAAAKSAATVAKLFSARDEAAAARNSQVHALVRATTGPTPAVQPETRTCPFT